MPERDMPFGANIEFTKLSEEQGQRIALMANNFRIAREDFEANVDAFEASEARVAVTFHFKEVLKVPLEKQLAAVDASLKEIERMKKLKAMTLTDYDRRFFATLHNLFVELLTLSPEALKTSPVLRATIETLAEQAQKDHLAHIRRQGEKFAAQWRGKGGKH